MQDSMLAQLKKQAASVLSDSNKKITQLEAVLKKLREDELVCLTILGKAPVPIKPAANGKRTDWVALLGQLPEEFKAADVIKIADKPAGGIYTQLYQMTKSGRLKRTGTGYEKLS